MIEHQGLSSLFASAWAGPISMRTLRRMSARLVAAFWLLVSLACVAEESAPSDPNPAPVSKQAAAPAVGVAPVVKPVAPNRPVPSRAELVKLVDAMAKRYQVEESLVHAIVRAESNYNPHAVSSAGAVGLMQVMPETAADYGVHSTDDLFDPTTNARTGTRHLKRLLDKYSIGKAVMAYNAGEGALERSGGFVTYPETQQYTHRVLTTYLKGKGIAPYSDEARKLTGIPLSPAMAVAYGAAPRGNSRFKKDVSRLYLRVRPSLLESALSKRALDPRAHYAGPESKPMFVLERRRPELRKR